MAEHSFRVEEVAEHLFQWAEHSFRVEEVAEHLFQWAEHSFRVEEVAEHLFRWAEHLFRMAARRGQDAVLWHERSWQAQRRLRQPAPV